MAKRADINGAGLLVPAKNGNGAGELETMEDVFICSRCGFCCQGETTVSLDEEDQRRMLDHMQISREEAMQKYWRLNGGQIQMRVINGHCIFYDDGCSVHTCRPWRCRQWPLVDAILKDAATVDIIKSSCPGLIRGASYERICEEVRRRRWLKKAEHIASCSGEDHAT